jgi:hypothetical protein
MKKLPFDSETTFKIPPGIHTEDAISAVKARLSECKTPWEGLKKMEGMFLDSVANPLGNLSESQIKSISELSGDKAFTAAFARAIYEGRMPLFSKVETIILRNWRVLQFDGMDSAMKALPGLWEWSPKAVTELFALIGLTDSMTPEAYKKARQRLGLRPQTPYYVTGVKKVLKKDAIEIITTDRPR